MQNVVSFGPGNSVPADRLIGKTYGEILQQVSPILGCGDNVDIFVNGVLVDWDEEYTGGAVSLVTRAAEKGAR